MYRLYNRISNFLLIDYVLKMYDVHTRNSDSESKFWNSSMSWGDQSLGLHAIKVKEGNSF